MGRPTPCRNDVFGKLVLLEVFFVLLDYSFSLFFIYYNQLLSSNSFLLSSPLSPSSLPLQFSYYNSVSFYFLDEAGDVYDFVPISQLSFIVCPKEVYRYLIKI